MIVFLFFSVGLSQFCTEKTRYCKIYVVVYIYHFFGLGAKVRLLKVRLKGRIGVDR